jgi:hypothetical protein
MEHRKRKKRTEEEETNLMRGIVTALYRRRGDCVCEKREERNCFSRRLQMREERNYRKI